MKPRSNSVLDGLPANQQEALERWLFEENLSYKDAAGRLHADFCVACSERGLSVWYQRRAQERRLAKISASAARANAVTKQFRDNPSQAFDALMQMIGQAAFELQMEGNTLPIEDLKSLTEIAVAGIKAKTDAHQLALKERDQTLRETKYRDLVNEQKRKIDAAVNTAKSKGGLTAETLKQIEEAASLL